MSVPVKASIPKNIAILNFFMLRSGKNCIQSQISLQNPAPPGEARKGLPIG
jgi:hypothetical protein